jgi:hypothetical protein
MAADDRKWRRVVDIRLHDGLVSLSPLPEEGR